MMKNKRSNTPAKEEFTSKIAGSEYYLTRNCSQNWVLAFSGSEWRLISTNIKHIRWVAPPYNVNISQIGVTASETEWRELTRGAIIHYGVTIWNSAFIQIALTRSVKMGAASCFIIFGIMNRAAGRRAVFGQQLHRNTWQEQPTRQQTSAHQIVSPTGGAGGPSCMYVRLLPLDKLGLIEGEATPPPVPLIITSDYVGAQQAEPLLRLRSGGDGRDSAAVTPPHLRWLRHLRWGYVTAAPFTLPWFKNNRANTSLVFKM